MKRAACVAHAFYATYAKPIVALLVLGVASGWALFLFVSEQAGGALLVVMGFAMLPFLCPTPQLARGDPTRLDRLGQGRLSFQAVRLWAAATRADNRALTSVVTPRRLSRVSSEVSGCFSTGLS